MSRGRGSAIIAEIVFLMLCGLLVAAEIAMATEYTVGDSSGWRFNVVDWPNGKTFKAGDVLVFNYNPKFHNVVLVTESGYTGCQTPSGSKMLQSGKDKVELVPGKNFFICNFPGHCESDMKIAVDVA